MKTLFLTVAIADIPIDDLDCERKIRKVLRVINGYREQYEHPLHMEREEIFKYSGYFYLYNDNKILLNKVLTEFMPDEQMIQAD